MLERLGDKVKKGLRGWTERMAGSRQAEELQGLARTENEYGVDPFGFNLDYSLAAIAPFLWLYRNYFRVEAHGADRVPSGRVLLVSNHSGQLPLDGAMIGIALMVEGNPPRAIRSMVEKWVPSLPYVSTFMARVGQIVGTPENCRRLLDAEEAILVFPEGTRGLNKLWPQRYQLQEFGLGFMRLALETNTPIVPIAVVGAEEQAPALMDLKPLAKLFGFPSFPITPTGTPFPLPTKYRIYFGDAMHFSGRSDDEDSELDKKVRTVKAAIQAMLHQGLKERRSVFLVSAANEEKGVEKDVGDKRPAVVVTGISGNLGRTLAKLLHKRERIIGIDRRPFPGRPKDVEMHQLDLRKKKAEDVFRKNEVRAVIHMGIMHDPRMSEEEHHSFNVVGTTRLLEYCAKYGVKKVVVLSSANVYGPSPDNSNFLTEDAPLMAASRFSGVRDLIEVDMLAHGFFWKHPNIETVILRPVHIVGPTIKNAPSNYLRLRYPWTLAGFDPMVQLIHVEDVARAMVEALRPEPKGVYNVVGPGQVPLSAVLGELGHTPIPVPHPVARPLLGLMFRYRLANFPPPELDHIQFLCAVDGHRWVQDVGWKARHSMRDTIRSVVGE